MSVKIWDICPFSSKKELGKCHNEFVALIPDTDWVLIRDPDTMYLNPHQRAWIENIVESKGNDWDLLGCLTNRIGNKENKADMLFGYLDEFGNQKHWYSPSYEIVCSPFDLEYPIFNCNAHYRVFNDEIKEANITAGFFMLFRKSLWHKIKFEQGIDFDIKFCNAVKKAGGRIGIMKGIYIFHNYRLGHENPTKYNKHLL